MINFVLKIQENKTLLRIYRTVSSVIQLFPYYIMEEVYIDQITNHCSGKRRFRDQCIDARRYGISLEIMKKRMIEKTEEYDQWWITGCICLAFRYKGEIAAYSWADLNYLKYKGRTVALKPNEAYLYNARTYKAFRGKNLAPYVRNELYKLLKQKGIDRFLSVTLLSNTASMKFKQKLGAKPIELFLYVGLFRKHHMHFRLRNMAHHR